MIILVIGSGGREHALVWKLKQSRGVDRIFCAPGNAGIAQDAECVSIAATDVEALLAFALEKRVDLTVVGPEAPLVAGIVDAFQERGLKIVGPRRYAAQLEGSKEFAKRFMLRHGVPTAGFRSFNRAEHEAARAFVAGHAMPVVVKADGLAAGKGVVVATTREDALAAIDAMLGADAFGDAGATVVIEEFLPGEEASVFAMTDGANYVTFAPAQDHKRIGDGDTGKNTGGMGAFAPAAIVTPEILAQVQREVVEPVLRGMREEGCPYTGFLYCGLMIGPDGPRVVEFNCRLGDPETQVVLPLIDGDFVELCMACAAGDMAGITVGQRDASAVCIVMAAGGYPDAYRSGVEISGLDTVARENGVVVFHAGTKRVDDALVTAGGRVLGVTAIGEHASLSEAIASAYAATEKITFAGAYYRRDIGAKGVRT